MVNRARLLDDFSAGANVDEARKSAPKALKVPNLLGEEESTTISGSTEDGVENV
jgi:hypothetical protein